MSSVLTSLREELLGAMLCIQQAIRSLGLDLSKQSGVDQICKPSEKNCEVMRLNKVDMRDKRKNGAARSRSQDSHVGVGGWHRKGSKQRKQGQVIRGTAQGSSGQMTGRKVCLFWNKTHVFIGNKQHSGFALIFDRHTRNVHLFSVISILKICWVFSKLKL